MAKVEIKQLIREKIKIEVKNDDIRSFIEDLLKIEQDYQPKTRKMNEYEKTLGRYIRMKK